MIGGTLSLDAAMDELAMILLTLPVLFRDIVRIGLLIAFPGLALWLVRLLS